MSLAWKTAKANSERSDAAAFPAIRMQHQLRQISKIATVNPDTLRIGIIKIREPVASCDSFQSSRKLNIQEFKPNTNFKHQIFIMSPPSAALADLPIFSTQKNVTPEEVGFNVPGLTTIANFFRNQLSLPPSLPMPSSLSGK